jgi:hypothetical protein
MDDSFLQLKHFQKTLEQFHDRVQSAWREVETTYEDLSPHWQDQKRQKHDEIWLDLQEKTNNYYSRQIPTYNDFLNHKLQVLERYLNGG